jgi:hypothetical protein
MNSASLKDVHDILLEAIVEYLDDGGELDEGLSIFVHF